MLPCSLTRLRPLTANITSPERMPERAAGLPDATAATCTPPEAVRSSQAPAHAVERDMLEHEPCPADTAVADVLPDLACPSQASTGTAMAIAHAMSKDITSGFFIVPPGEDDCAARSSRSGPLSHPHPEGR